MLDNQTLQDKYPHLEVSMLKLSEVKKDNESFRIDSEYFKKEYLENEKRIKTNYVLLGNIIELLTDGKHGGVTLTDSGVLFLKNTNIEEGIIKIDEKLFISEEESSQTKRAEVKEGNILLSTIGTVGLSAVVPKGFPRATINQNLVKIVLKQGYSSYFISTFFNSYYGKYQMIRMSAGNIYQMINYPNLRKIKIPIFPMPFQLEIEKLVKDSHKALESSKALYKEAEALLYEALGLDSKNPLQSILESKITDYHDLQGKSCDDNALNPNYTIATLRESFLKTGRLDAEYYQSKYEDIETKIHNFPTIKLMDLVQYPITSGATPKAGGSDYTDFENGIPFLRAVDLKNARVDIANLLYIKPETHAKSLKRTKLTKGDVLFSIAGVIGRCAIFDYDFEANINQALAILRFTESKGIKRLYLIAFFNSQFGQIYLERYSRQGLQTNLNLDEVGNLEIPIIDSTTQAQIAAYIQKSFELRAEAKILLESAKAEVESALNNANNGGGGG